LWLQVAEVGASWQISKCFKPKK